MRSIPLLLVSLAFAAAPAWAQTSAEKPAAMPHMVLDPVPVAAQIMALGAVHAGSCALVYFGVGWGSQSVLRSRPAAALAVSRLSGTLMLVIAAVLLGEIAVQHL